MPEPSPPAAAPRRPPRMVLVDRRVGFVDELEATILENGDLPLKRMMESALRDLGKLTGNNGERASKQYWAIQKQIDRYREDQVEERAFAILRERKACRPNAVRKEPLEGVEASFFFGETLDGIEPCCHSDPVPDAPPSLTRFSLKISWPSLNCGYPYTAFIASCHRYLLVFYVGSYRGGYDGGEHLEPNFYLVYNVWANSLAIVPKPYSFEDTSHCDIGAGEAGLGAELAVLCCGGDGDYVLAELLLQTDARSLLPTNKATLFLWSSGPLREWERKEVVLPLPADDDTASCSFRADMVFAVSSSSICWVDLLTGILVYNHIGSGEFHFIPLPEEYAMNTFVRMTGRPPESHRSMCCIDRQTLKFVAMDSYSQPSSRGEWTLTTWTLRRPLSPRNWTWVKDAVSSFSIKNLWDNTAYREDMKLRPLMPSCPVISTQQPGIMYLLVTYYEYSDLYERLEPGGLFVLSLNMDRCRVESAYKVPSDENGRFPRPRIFTSDFSIYLNKTRDWELLHECLRRKELADEGESRSSPSTPYTVGADLGVLKLFRGGLGARRVIPTNCSLVGPRSRKAGQRAASPFCPVGLQAALD